MQAAKRSVNQRVGVGGIYSSFVFSTAKNAL
jgi:hypothetical protein